MSAPLPAMVAHVDEQGRVWCGSPGCRRRHPFGAFMLLIWTDRQDGPVAHSLRHRPSEGRNASVQYVERGTWRLEDDGYHRRTGGQTSVYRGDNPYLGPHGEDRALSGVPRLPAPVECPDCRRKQRVVGDGWEDITMAVWEGSIRLGLTPRRTRGTV